MLKSKPNRMGDRLVKGRASRKATVRCMLQIGFQLASITDGRSDMPAIESLKSHPHLFRVVQELIWDPDSL